MNRSLERDRTTEDKSMKNLFFVLVLILFMCSSFAQSGTYLGLRAGAGLHTLYNPRWVNPEGTVNSVERGEVLGTFYGLEFLYNFVDIPLGIKAGYIKKVYNYQMSVNYVLPGNLNALYTIENTEIPLILQINNKKMDTRKTAKAFSSGVYYEIGIQYQTTNKVNISSYWTTNFEETQTEDYTDEFVSTSFAPIIGIGLLHLTRGRFQILHGLRYTHTLGDFQNNDSFEFFKPNNNFDGWEGDYRSTTLLSLSYVLQINIGIWIKTRF